LTRPSAYRRGRHRWLAAGLFVLTVAGCDALDPANRGSGLTKAQFVDVIVALREAERELLLDETVDSAHVEFARVKDEILQDHGVTELEIRAFVARHRNRPAAMTEAWDRIAQRLGVRSEDIMEGMPSLDALPDMGERGPPQIDAPLTPDHPLRLEAPPAWDARPATGQLNPGEDIR
jgi:hypothetical protein